MIRIYEVAKDLGLPNKIIVEKIRGLGIDVKNHMSSISTDDVDRLKKSLERPRTEATVEKRLKSTVIRRRSKGAGASAPTAASSASGIEVVEPPPAVVVAKSVVDDGAGHSDKPRVNGEVQDWASTTATARALKSRPTTVSSTNAPTSSVPDVSTEIAAGASSTTTVPVEPDSPTDEAKKVESAPVKPKRVIR